MGVRVMLEWDGMATGCRLQGFWEVTSLGTVCVYERGGTTLPSVSLLPGHPEVQLAWADHSPAPLLHTLLINLVLSCQEDKLFAS